MKKWLIALAATVAVGGGAAAGATIYNNQPEVVVRHAITNAIEDLCERDEISPVMNMLEKGSLELNVDADMAALGMISDVDSIKAGGKIYFSDDALMIENLNVRGGELNFSADAYIGEDLVYVSNEEILGGSWGVIRGEMSKTFGDSELVDWLGLDDDTKEAIEKVLESYDDGKDKELKKDLEKYLKKYMKTLVLAIEKNAEYESESDEIKINGDRVSARVIEVTIDGEAAVGILEYIYDELKDDDKLRETVLEYLEEYEDTLKKSGVISEDDDVADLYDDLIDKLGDAIGEMDDNADNMEGEIIFKVVTPKMSSKLMQLSMIEKDDDGKFTVFTLDIGKKGIKKSEQIALTIGDYVTYEYEIKDNDSKEYKAELKEKYEDETYTLFKISVDKKDDTFKLVTDGVTLSGDFISKGKTTTVTLNKIKAGDITVKDIEITLIIKEKDKMPEPEENVKNIFEITEDDVKEITENAENMKFGFEGFGKEDFAPDPGRR